MARVPARSAWPECSQWLSCSNGMPVPFRANVAAARGLPVHGHTAQTSTWQHDIKQPQPCDPEQLRLPCLGEQLVLSEEGKARLVYEALDARLLLVLALLGPKRNASSSPERNPPAWPLQDAPNLVAVCAASHGCIGMLNSPTQQLRAVKQLTKTPVRKRCFVKLQTGQNTPVVHLGDEETVAMFAGMTCWMLVCTWRAPLLRLIVLNKHLTSAKDSQHGTRSSRRGCTAEGE
jgi:hypothetical protein